MKRSVYGKFKIRHFKNLVSARVRKRIAGRKDDRILEMPKHFSNYKGMNAMKKMSIREFATEVGVTPDTVRRWERKGKITPVRTSGGHRRYSEKDIKQIKKGPEKRNIIYCRVSNSTQSEDLKRQVEAMELFALGRGIEAEIITEVGGGMDLSRPKLMEVIYAIIGNEVDSVMVAHKDRLARFGFALIENIAENYGCEIVSASVESLSPQHEVVTDFMSVINDFSHRLDGLNKIRNSKSLVDELAEV